MSRISKFNSIYLNRLSMRNKRVVRILKNNDKFKSSLLKMRKRTKPIGEK